MSVSYNKLWKLLIDKGMSKTQLIKAAKISTNAWPSWVKTRMCVWKRWSKSAARWAVPWMILWS